MRSGGDDERVDQPGTVGDRRDVAVPGRAQGDGRVVDRVDEADRVVRRVVAVAVAVAVEVDQQHGAHEDRQRRQQPAPQLPPRGPGGVRQGHPGVAHRARVAWGQLRHAQESFTAMRLAQPLHQLEPRARRGALGEDGVEGRVDRGADEHGDGQQVEPQHHRDGGGERAVDRPGLRRRDGQHPAQHEGARDPGDQREHRPGEVERPVGPHRHRHVVERGQEADAQQQHQRPVEAHQELEALRQPPLHQGGPGHHQRDAHHAGEHRHHVEDERQRPGLDDPPVPPEPVHDRDGVDEDVERPRARPQREHEADRDHVVAPALEDGVDGRAG